MAILIDYFLTYQKKKGKRRFWYPVHADKGSHKAIP